MYLNKHKMKQTLPAIVLEQELFNDINFTFPFTDNLTEWLLV